ncbi:signal peptide peptidase SppA [Leptospira langatensis]|uniref:Signal peptide peptidase SppA n=1 Tax=Leptospira langatensis TaxID=2484983 RepID=A0A5F1ZXH0_9LEPT|nr:signal peptide peptidase SppA [Leptospira langatensis]TGK04085.1 signal peptide peptidase SppA [Leptospira langatensis]TGL43565.1 signal peptide peptidase SppA [Leptospira langatensis]
MNFRTKGFLLLLLGILPFTHCITIPLTPQPLAIPQEKLVEGFPEGGKDKILVIPIEGEIFERKISGNALTKDKASLVSLVKIQLALALKDPDIKAVILKVDSPGGSVTASDLIYHEILEFKRKKGIPVLALFMDVAASGAYYLSMATDHIQALPTTTTGSIGVIMFNINAKEALDKLGIKSMTIRSGPNKATGNPLEEFTSEQRKIYQDLITENYERFLQIVKKGRPKLKESDIRRLADGRIYSTNQALREGLVDSVGYFEDAVTTTTKLPGYRSSSPGLPPTVVFYSYQKSVPENFYQIESNSAEKNLLENILPFKTSPDYRLHYLFSP